MFSLFPSLSVLSSGGFPEPREVYGGSTLSLGIDPVNQLSGFDFMSWLTVARHLVLDATRNFGAGRATQNGSFAIAFRAVHRRLEGADISLIIAMYLRKT